MGLLLSRISHAPFANRQDGAVYLFLLGESRSILPSLVLVVVVVVVVVDLVVVVGEIVVENVTAVVLVVVNLLCYHSSFSSRSFYTFSR